MGSTEAKTHAVPPASQAAWGGSVLLSRTHRHLLDGIQRCIQPPSRIPPFKSVVLMIVTNWGAWGGSGEMGAGEQIG